MQTQPVLVTGATGKTGARIAQLADGASRALDRPPRDFTDVAHEVATTGLWRNVA